MTPVARLLVSAPHSQRLESDYVRARVRTRTHAETDLREDNEVHVAGKFYFNQSNRCTDSDFLILTGTFRVVSSLTLGNTG